MTATTGTERRRSYRVLTRIGPFGWTAIALGAAFLLLFGYPVVSMVLRIFFPENGSAGDVWQTTFSGRGVGEATRNTAILVVAVNLIAVPIGLFFAWLTQRTDATLGWISTILPVLPLLLPPVSLSVGWLILTNPRAGFLDHWLRGLGSALGLDSSGWSLHLESWGGLILVYVVFVIPTVYVIGSAAFRNMDSSLEEAARVYGRGILRTFATISLPAIKPAIGASVLLVSIAAAELYSIPAIMGTPAGITTLSTYIARLIRGQYPPKLDEAVLLGALVALFLLALWLVQRQLNARGHHATIGGMGMRANRIALGRYRWLARASLIGYVLVAAILPFVALVIVALQNFWQPTVAWENLSTTNFVDVVNEPLNRTALTNSLILGVTTATCVVLVAVALTVYSVIKGGVLGEALSGLTKLPAAISTLVLAVGVILVYAGTPFDLSGTLYILLIVFILTRMTNASIVIEGGVAQIGRQLLEASRVSGAGLGRTFGRVMLPLSLSTMAIAWIFAFAHTVGDLTASVILSGPQNPTLGYQISVIYEYGSYPKLAALSVVVALISAIAVGLALRFARARFTA